MSSSDAANARRRLIAALDGFVQQRQKGVRSTRHVVPIVEFAAAELRARGIPSTSIQNEAWLGRYYERPVDLVVKNGDAVALTLIVMTQSGSVRRNLTNRKRDIIGDCINLRAANPQSLVGVIYLLRADEEAKRKSPSGTSPIEELATFLASVQVASSPPLLDAAALIAADRDTGGRIRIDAVPDSVDVLATFFDRLAVVAKRASK